MTTRLLATFSLFTTMMALSSRTLWPVSFCQARSGAFVMSSSRSRPTNTERFSSTFSSAVNGENGARLPPSPNVVIHRQAPLQGIASLSPPPLSSTSMTSNVLRTFTTNKQKLSIADTPLGSPSGASLLDGLDVYEVPALGDQHPLAVFGVDSLHVDSSSTRPPILLLHGRTWSSVPVYHLLGGGGTGWISDQYAPQQSRSLMERLLATGLQPYAMDFRGFGGTPPDASGYVEPNQCVQDVETVLHWIAQRHGLNATLSALSTLPEPTTSEMPALLGWSQGALIAQLVAQHHGSRLLSKLILYGSIYDPLVRYPREPLYQQQQLQQQINEPIQNTFNDAIEDFTVQGSIPPEPAQLFAHAALLTDPIKAVWKHQYQFNNCDPARVQVPTLLIAGDQDPYAPLHVQQELFVHLGRGSDRQWSILAQADHAAHLLDAPSQRFINTVTSFITDQ